MKVDSMKVQAEIARRQMTITDFAKQSGLSIGAVYRAINGGQSTLRTAGRIAALLQINPNEIFSAQIKETD